MLLPLRRLSERIAMQYPRTLRKTFRLVIACSLGSEEGRKAATTLKSILVHLPHFIHVHLLVGCVLDVSFAIFPH